MNKNTVITIILIVVAIFAISFFYKQNHQPKDNNIMDEIGHEMDELGDEIEDKTN